MALHGIYHILAKPPALYKEQMPIELEELALQLLLMGRVRIDADEQRNFVRYTCPFREVNVAFSNRELTDPMLLDRTEDILTSMFDVPHNSRVESPRQQARDAIKLIKNEAKKNFLLSLEKEMQIARILVQCADPSVIMLIIAEGIEIFVTYGPMVGDLMDIVSWQQFGMNSGLQSTDGKKAAIFVACAGNPLLIPSEDEQPTFVSDGYSALARMMIVAAQEIAHFSDIIRDERGFHVARHSSNISVSKPTVKAEKSRKKDVAALHKLRSLLVKCGVQPLASLEAEIRFMKRRRRYSILARIYAIKGWFMTIAFKQRCKKNAIAPWRQLVKKNHHIASQLLMAIDDMQFQLDPDVDAYRDANPQVEEAVKCAEALARVPQQVIKWGHDFTKLTMPNLYKLYYGEVIPACEKAYENVTRGKYRMKFTMLSHFSWRWLKFKYISRPPQHKPLPYFRDEQY